MKFKNKVTGEVHEMWIELKEGESILSAAWSRGVSVVCQIKGWNRMDVVVI